jgi:hypothetical protein
MADGYTTIERRCELLREQHRVLGVLLDDPHPGLATWMGAVPKVVQEMQAIMNGERDDAAGS